MSAVKQPLSFPRMVRFLAGLLAATLSLTARAQSGTPLCIGKTILLPSKILEETRTINISLPEGYDSSDTLSYPVVYVLDGGIDEDFLHILGLVRYNATAWVNRFPKSIVVGIQNSNRQRDFTFAVPNLDFLRKVGYSEKDVTAYGGSAHFISFIEKELQPFIRSAYKTDGHKTIIGESLAGLLATEILLKQPALFNTYIIVSPSLWWGDEVLLRQADSLLAANVHQGIRVYVGTPAKEDSRFMYEDAKALYKHLKRNGNISVYFDYLPGETHATVLHQAVYNAFMRLDDQKGSAQ
ncbi:MAG TPA: alpha/beta hydrolase-fold protein [Edaphocola sp.]|nr:alpha/beta hydrolase-fold protein [Edaphocola sp.]